MGKGKFVYTVSTGGRKYTYRSPQPADPFTVATIIIFTKTPKNLGMILEVSGGHLTEPVFVGAERACTKLGMWAAPDEEDGE